MCDGAVGNELHFLASSALSRGAICDQILIMVFVKYIFSPPPFLMALRGEQKISRAKHTALGSNLH